jgi:hypothetical protein
MSNLVCLNGSDIIIKGIDRSYREEHMIYFINGLRPYVENAKVSWFPGTSKSDFHMEGESGFKKDNIVAKFTGYPSLNLSNRKFTYGFEYVDGYIEGVNQTSRITWFVKKGRLSNSIEDANVPGMYFYTESQTVQGILWVNENLELSERQNDDSIGFFKGSYRSHPHIEWSNGTLVLNSVEISDMDNPSCPLVFQYCVRHREIVEKKISYPEFNPFGL